jgi:hypothetical protein
MDFHEICTELNSSLDSEAIADPSDNFKNIVSQYLEIKGAHPISQIYTLNSSYGEVWRGDFDIKESLMSFQLDDFEGFNVDGCVIREIIFLYGDDALADKVPFVCSEVVNSAIVGLKG